MVSRQYESWSFHETFMLSGYDVWLGNARGNSYSRRHTRLTADEKAFWDFSWHEIGETSSVIGFLLQPFIVHTLIVDIREQILAFTQITFFFISSFSGVIDLPAMINFVLATTEETNLHFIGHSQGTTSFFVMAATEVEMNDKIRTMHAFGDFSFL